jgi:hypothetical protein
MGRFTPGQSGNPRGRPKGSRNRLGEEFVDALYADFQKHGAKVIADVRDTKPEVYLKVVASILPRLIHLDGNDISDLSDEELDQRIRELSDALGLTAGEREVTR